MEKIFLVLAFILPFGAHCQLQEFFEREASYGHFNGSVLVQRGDEVILEFNAGNATAGNPIKSTTSFEIGSVSKQFMAAAILHLVKEGKLDLHGPINQYLGAYATDLWKKVTVHHLLTHMSGIPSLYQTEQGLELYFPQTYPIAKKELIGKFNGAKLLFSPGKRFSYNNSGYILLAAIVEEVSGQSVSEFFQNTIFDPYGLNHTSPAATDASASPYYGYRQDLLREAPRYHPSWFFGAGGIHSTAKDLTKWMQTVVSEDFLTEELRGLFLKDHTNEDYGYGWVVNSEGKISHDGGSAGATSFISFNPTTNESIVILTNRGFEAIHQYEISSIKMRHWVRQIENHMRGKPLELLPLKTKDPVSSGQFLLADQKLNIAARDSVIEINIPGTAPSRIIPNTPLPGTIEAEKKLIHIADRIARRKYWGLAKYCNGEMKLIVYSGMFSLGFKRIQNQVGKVEQSIAYKIEDGRGVFRMKGSNIVKDIIVYYDGEGKIQGIFEHGDYEKDRELKMLAYPIGSGQYYLDGYPYGEPSATLTITGSTIIVEQNNRQIIGHQVN